MIRFALALIFFWFSACPGMAEQPRMLPITIGGLEVSVPFLSGIYFTLKDGSKITAFSPPLAEEERKLTAAITKYGFPLPASELIINFRHLCDKQNWKSCVDDGRFSIPLDNLIFNDHIPNINGPRFSSSTVDLRKFGIANTDIYEIKDPKLLCHDDICTFLLAIRNRGTISFSGFNPRSNTNAMSINSRALHYIDLFLIPQRAHP